MRRIYVFLILLGAFSLTFHAGSMTEVDPAEAEAFLEEFEALIEDIDAVGIFVHNTSLALPMFIPGFGAAWGLFSAWSTGYAFAAIVSLTPALADVPALAFLFLTPFGLMELAAYSLATSRSCILIGLILRRRPLGPHLKATAAEIGIVVALLLAGGFVEFYMIETLERDGQIMPEL